MRNKTQDNIENIETTFESNLVGIHQSKLSLLKSLQYREQHFTVLWNAGTPLLSENASAEL